MTTMTITSVDIVEHVRRLISDRLARVRAYEQACREGRMDGNRCAALIDAVTETTDLIGLAGLLSVHGADEESRSIEQGITHMNDIARTAAFNCRMACIGRAPWQQQAQEA